MKNPINFLGAFEFWHKAREKKRETDGTSFCVLPIF